MPRTPHPPPRNFFLDPRIHIVKLMKTDNNLQLFLKLHNTARVFIGQRHSL